MSGARQPLPSQPNGSMSKCRIGRAIRGSKHSYWYGLLPLCGDIMVCRWTTYHVLGVGWGGEYNKVFVIVVIVLLTR